MRTVFLFVLLAFLAPPVMAAAPQGEVSLHVWPAGQKAAQEAITSFGATATDYEKILKAEWRPADENIFRGCFLARFTPAKGERTPASAAKPARVCFSR